MEKHTKQKVKIKILKTKSRYGLKRGETIELVIVQRKNRTTVFFEPPMRHLELFNEDWNEVKS